MRDRPDLASGAALTAAEVARAVVADQARELKGGTRKARKGKDPEAVHRLRVATRRLRAALRLVGADLAVRDDLTDRLAWAARRLGAVRDADVILELLGRLAAAGSVKGVEAERLDRLQRRLRRRRRRTQQRLRAALKRRRWTKLLRSLRRFARQPRLLPDVEPLGPRVLARADALAAVIAAQPAMHEARPSAAALHQLRIAFKRLRYVLEVHAAVDSLAYGVELRLAREIQDALGLIRDHDLVIERLAKGRGAFGGTWTTLRPVVLKERAALLRRFLRLRREWSRQTRPEPVTPVESLRFVNLEPQPVTLRLVGRAS